jgi:hypothetical protein
MRHQCLRSFAFVACLLAVASCGEAPTFFAPFDVVPDSVQADGGDTPDGGVADGDTPGGDTPDGDTPDGDAPDGDSPDGDSPDTGPTCGNSTRDAGELCDGAELGGSTCQDFAFTGGTLSCGVDCLSYDFSACVGGGEDPVCGNGEREAGEVCDGAEVGGSNCQGFGFDQGSLTCLDTCQGYDFSACENDVCVPDCSGRECGADPICGESCGSCAASENCDAAGQCIAAAGAAPRFITFDTNVRRITDGESVRFTAVVTDPDGIDDLIGGTLRDPVSGSTYGSFSTSAAEGSYQIELSWADIHFVRPIDLVDTEPRIFEAQFFDTAANLVSREMSIELYCDGGDAGAACEGSCTRIDNTSRCGSCELSCGAANVCEPDAASFSCVCEEEFALCGGECLDRYADDSCGDACTVCGASQFCDVAGCAPLSEEIRVTEDDILQVQHLGEWRGVCDDGFSDPEAAVACRQLGGTLLEYSLSATGPSSLFWLDDLSCTGEESRLADCRNAGWGNENCSIGEHVRIICSNTGSVCEQPSAAAFISEVFYDAAGSDTGLEFIELFSFNSVSFGGTTLELVNADGSVYGEIEIPSDASVVGGGDQWYLLGQSSVPGADATFTEVIQNGPDAIVWRGCDDGIIDVVQYGLPEALFSEDGGNPALDIVEALSLSRFTTTGDNFSDFAAGLPTPGSANESALEPAGYFELFEMTTIGGGSFTRPEEPCDIGVASGFLYDARTLTNPGRTLTVTIRAEYSTFFDGYLFGYLGSFIPGSPTSNCEDGNDDDVDTTASEITLEWPNGQDLIVVLSGYDTNDIGTSSITVTEVVAE